MRPALHDPPAVQTKHQVRLPNRAQAVRHHKGRPPAQQNLQGPLQARFGHGVDGAGRLVQAPRCADRPAWRGRNRPIAAAPAKAPRFAGRPGDAARPTSASIMSRQSSVCSVRRTSASVASGRAKRMLSSTEPEKRKLFCCTLPICACSESPVTSRRLYPSIRMRPRAGR
jgi:hypothetical protein